MDPLPVQWKIPPQTRKRQILLQGGFVLDGTGGRGEKTDVLVENDRIAALGDFTRTKDALIVDAGGCCVSPGFIDAHSHSDAYLILDPEALAKISQGFTTEVVGQCGASAAPLYGEARMPADWASHAYPGAWDSFASWLQVLKEARPAVHVVPFVGHNTLRAGVTGFRGGPLDEADLRRLCARLEQSLDEGAAGLSMGLPYPHGIHADAREILALAAVVARRDGCISVHLRDEGLGLLDSLDAMRRMARATGVRLQISHLKTSVPEAWPLLDQALEIIEQGRDEGLRIAADRYPYTAGATDLDIVLPAWATGGDRTRQTARLRDPAAGARLAREIETLHADKDWAHVMIGATWHPGNRRWRGRRLNDIAAAMKKTAGEAIVDILGKDAGRTGAFFFGMSPENMRKIYRQPWVMPGSDASTRSPVGPLAGDYPHPRAYGCVPRFLRMVLDEKRMPLPEAVRRLTSLPAEQFGLNGRGVLRPGAFADIAVWNPETLRDHATYANPNRLSEGITTLLVNGKIILSKGS